MSAANSVAAPCARSCARSVIARRGPGYPAALALLWRDTANEKPLRYITFNGKYLVVKNV